jgi:hypothetical protein
VASFLLSCEGSLSLTLQQAVFLIPDDEYKHMHENQNDAHTTQKRISLSLSKKDHATPAYT